MPKTEFLFTHACIFHVPSFGFFAFFFNTVTKPAPMISIMVSNATKTIRAAMIAISNVLPLLVSVEVVLVTLVAGEFENSVEESNVCINIRLETSLLQG